MSSQPVFRMCFVIDFIGCVLQGIRSYLEYFLQGLWLLKFFRSLKFFSAFGFFGTLIFFRTSISCLLLMYLY